MSIASELNALQQDITAARAAISAKGGTTTDKGGSSQLAADINTIPSGGTPSKVEDSLTATANGNYTPASGHVYSSVLVNVPTQEEQLSAIIDRTVVHASIPAGVTVIGNSAFCRAASLRSVAIPDTVTKIDAYAFDYCSALEELDIPASVTQIYTAAIRNCTSMRTLRFLGTTPPTVYSSAAFTALPTSCVIHVPAGTLAAYKSATNYPNPSTYTYVEDDAET